MKCKPQGSGVSVVIAAAAAAAAAAAEVVLVFCMCLGGLVVVYTYITRADELASERRRFSRQVIIRDF